MLKSLRETREFKILEILFHYLWNLITRPLVGLRRARLKSEAESKRHSLNRARASRKLMARTAALHEKFVTTPRPVEEPARARASSFSFVDGSLSVTVADQDGSTFVRPETFRSDPFNQPKPNPPTKKESWVRRRQVRIERTEQRMREKSREVSNKIGDNMQSIREDAERGRRRLEKKIFGGPKPNMWDFDIVPDGTCPSCLKKGHKNCGG